METLRYLNKEANAAERQNFSNWWREQINIHGLETQYYTNLTTLKNSNQLYGENPMAGFGEGKTIIPLFNLNNDSIILSKFGLIADSDMTGVIHPEDFKKTFGMFAEPKADDVMVLSEYGVDRLGYPKRGAIIFQLTEVIDEFFGNPLGGHYVWFFKAKRYDYSYEPNSPGSGQGNNPLDDTRAIEKSSYNNFYYERDNPCSNTAVYGNYQSTITPSITSTERVSDNIFELYTPKNFKIHSLFKKSANFNEEVLSIIKDAIDHWSLILKDTILPGQILPSELYDGQDYFKNPLPFVNRGYVLCVNLFDLKNDDVLGQGSYIYARNNPNQTYHQLPSVGFLVLNEKTINRLVNKKTFGGKTDLYYVVLHELAHAFGIGTAWHILNNGGLERSFCVSAGDNSQNSLGSVGNVFYTCDRGNRGRTHADVGSLIGVGDASFTFAYNPSTPIKNKSKAVTAYCECFKLALTAIPLENEYGIGSFGKHWAEGSQSNPLLDDKRQYYGQTYPGAPCLQDELMTTILQTGQDLPCSKITLGALADLGWIVDFSKADNYEPLKHILRYSQKNPDIMEVKKNNFGGSIPALQDGSYKIFNHLKKGLTYTFINETADMLIFINGLNLETGSVMTENLQTGYNENKEAYISLTLPEDYSNEYITIMGSVTRDDLLKQNGQYLKKCTWRVV